MTTFSALVEMALVFTAIVTPITLAIRALAGWMDDVDGVVRTTPMGWPRGVQEEEPQPWRFGPAAA